MKVGVEVITGFLGAGKSAFINSLINKTIATKERIVVITCENGNTQINEFTENGQSVKHINFMGESLKLNDCIYSVVKKYKPHRIIIEYNGTDTLEHLYKCVFDNKTGKLIKLSTIYFICDGRNIEFYIKNMGEILLPFIQNSDVIVINNFNIEKRLELEKGIKLLEGLNHKAQILIAENNDGFNLALENSNLLEDKLVRDMRVKLIDYIRK
ncbi:GTP-binding protein [Clostridium sp.]|jgi:G3E family GTPase|uniref:GTP-binding protein n=1 Tax=Clostridium sp. TaxID=1506 RepID=UPI0025BC4F6E|nr:GTP-binding protein [Clostridium sp.]MCI9070048.1 GTP-binding protein [Clostridium sp.]